MSDSAYTKALKEGITRVSDLTHNYTYLVRRGEHGLAAIVRGELDSARAHMTGMVLAHDLLMQKEDDE